jgi:hypothetical protein
MMARMFGDFAKRVPDIMDCRDDKGRFGCKQIIEAVARRLRAPKL